VIDARTLSKNTEAGAALLIVLAFTVLITGLVIAFFTRTTSDRQLSRSSLANTAADALARGALEIVVGDFRQEIFNAGAPTSTTVVPKRAGNSQDIPNLIRRSVRSDGLTLPAVATRASSVNSTNDASANGRSISASRWNKHYLVPRLNTGSTAIDTTPTPSFVAPDWVFVTPRGPTILATPDLTTLGRYAFAVYDEGGLLDVNVAGFPAANSVNSSYLSTIGKKGVLAFADLTATGLSSNSIDNLIGWRNYSSGNPSGSYSVTSPFDFGANPTAFVQYFLESTTPSGSDRKRDFGVVSTPSIYNDANPRTDQAFINRTQLLNLRSTLQANQDALQSLGTFSREINLPTWSDASTRLAKRFPLSRFDYFANPGANTGQIQQYFGLKYVPASPLTAEHWQYVGSTGTLQSTIPPLSGVAQDPGLFTLLQYALPTASIGELLSIGASWIDQVDSNNETTWIEYALPDPSLPARKAFGVDRNPSPEPDAPPSPATVLVLNRSFRNVGELGYGYRNGTTSLDFRIASSADTTLLDLFTYNTATPRSGSINLNTQNSNALNAILRGAIIRDVTSATSGNPSYITQAAAVIVATNIISDPVNGSATRPLLSRAGIGQLTAAARIGLGATEEEQELVARALAEVTQTRTWGLMIDVIAQSGRFSSGTTNLSRFVVEAEKRYWLHVAIDRLTGKLIDQQLEAVYE
jgi:Tfp pilus assembly protein PilX